MRDIGYRKLRYSSTGADTGIAPDSPDAAHSSEISDADEIVVFAETLTAGHAAHTSTNWSLNFYVGFYDEERRDGTLIWETVASMSQTGLGDNKAVRIRVEDANGNPLSGDRMKIDADVIDAADLEADVYIWVRKRQRN